MCSPRLWERGIVPSGNDAADRIPPTRPDSAAGDARDRLIGEVLNDFLDRRGRGEPLSVARLLAQHPDLANELREHLDLLRDL